MLEKSSSNGPEGEKTNYSPVPIAIGPPTFNKADLSFQGVRVGGEFGDYCLTLVSAQAGGSEAKLPYIEKTTQKSQVFYVESKI